jgi:hypothetical protein
MGTIRSQVRDIEARSDNRHQGRQVAQICDGSAPSPEVAGWSVKVGTQLVAVAGEHVKFAIRLLRGGARIPNIRFRQSPPDRVFQHSRVAHQTDDPRRSSPCLRSSVRRRKAAKASPSAAPAAEVSTPLQVSDLVLNDRQPAYYEHRLAA